MGVTKNQPRKYFKISYGKIVANVEQGTPDAVERVTTRGKTVYELIYNDIFGTLSEIKFREDSEFGNSWQISFEDAGTFFTLQLPEDSKYCREFLQKLPLLNYNKYYRFAPYEFVNNSAKKSGLNIYTEDGKKVNSYFHKFTQVGDKWEIEYLNGFPPFNGNKDKKSDWKKYGIDVSEFLREFALQKIQAGEMTEHIEPGLEKDDLPF